MLGEKSMPIVSVQKLEDADKDADSLNKFVNGAETESVKTRLNAEYPTLASAVRQIMETGGFEPFAMEAALLASIPTVEKKAAKALDTKKIWYWDGVQWNDTGLSELDLANKETNQSIVNNRKEITFAPADSFSDSSFSVVDVDGRVLSDFEKIHSNLTKTLVMPFSNFDEKSLESVDSDFFALDEQKNIISDFFWQKEIYVEYELLTKTLKVAWKHDENLMFQTVWCPNGHNSLFNFKSMSKAVLGDPSKANWIPVQSETSDFLPPITFIATDGVVSDSGTTTVGGNHGTSGGEGLLTAHMTEFNIFKDGLLLNSDFVGYADLIQTKHTNMIYAGNTVNEQRYCMQQDFHLNFTVGNVEVLAEETALNNIKIYRNGGTQLIGGPWNDSAHFYGGTQQGPLTGTATTIMQAGTKTTAPECWATVLKSNELGFCAAWIDRGYGSKLDHIGQNDYMAFKNNNSWKFYNFVVRVDAEGGRDYPTGTKFKWRGGYSYTPISIVNGIDSAFIFKKGKTDYVGYSVLANTYGEINLPTNLIGTEAQDLESSLNGYSLAETNYTATYSKLG